MVKKLIIALSGLFLLAPLVHAIDIDMKIISIIESHNNPFAHNKTDDSRGTYQITPICLADYNNFHPHARYTLNDLWQHGVNQTIARWYIRFRIPQLLIHFNQDITEENVLIAYNCGISCVIKGRKPAITRRYIEKYNRLKQKRKE